MSRSFDGQGFGLDPADRDLFYQTLRASQRVVGLQTRLRSSSGACHDLLMHAHRVDYLGEKSFLVVATDVSELKPPRLPTAPGRSPKKPTARMQTISLA